MASFYKFVLYLSTAADWLSGAIGCNGVEEEIPPKHSRERNSVIVTENQQMHFLHFNSLIMENEV